MHEPFYVIPVQKQKKREKKAANYFFSAFGCNLIKEKLSSLHLMKQYLTKQNLALKEVNDSRMQIYETLDVSIRDLEIEKHGLMVQTSNDKKLIKR